MDALSFDDAKDIAHMHRNETMKERNLSILQALPNVKDDKRLDDLIDSSMPVKFTDNEFVRSKSSKPTSKEEAYARAAKTGARLTIAKRVR